MPRTALISTWQVHKCFEFYWILFGEVLFKDTVDCLHYVASAVDEWMSMKVLQHYEKYGEAFVCRLLQVDEPWVFHKHPREQGWFYDLEASSLSCHKDVQDSVVPWESDYHCFLGCLLSYIGWFHTSQFKNKWSCLSGNFIETHRGYLEWPQEFFCTTKLDFSVLPQLWTSWNPGAGKFFHIHRTVLIWHRRIYVFPPKMQNLLRSQWFHSN